MKAARIVLAILTVSAAVTSCKKRDPIPPPRVPAVNEIVWFNGNVAGAFAKADVENKPVFLYWGAQWCPYCKDLEANVFSRRDFVEKSRLFVPVYLDGDDPGAQKLGEEFKITGYPTVIVVRGDRTELARIGGGMDRNQYAEVLDLVLGDTRPVSEILAALDTGDAPLSMDDCRRLAFNAWILDEVTMQDSRHLAAGLVKAIARCPVDARIERARLTAVAASAAASGPESTQFKNLLQGV